MSTMASLSRRLAALEQRRNGSRESPVLGQIRRRPQLLMECMGRTCDPWQQTILTNDWTTSASRRTLMLASRQSGKSTVAAALAVKAALLSAPALVLLLSPSARQSSELYRKCSEVFRAAGQPVGVVVESALRVEFTNGSRIVSLPGKDDGAIRGFSAPKLVIIDEASRVSDQLYRGVRPMLATVPDGHLLALSTPWGRRGWFHEAWTGSENWDKVKVVATDCPRITPEFLAEEKAELGERFWKQEYFCEFVDVLGSLLSTECIMASLSDDVKPLFSRAARD
jgi:hypothetical protein